MMTTTNASALSRRLGFWTPFRDGLQRVLGLACLLTPLAVPLTAPQVQADEITYWNLL